MRKLLAFSVLAASLSLAPSHADPGNGCIAETTGGGPDTNVVCSYEATGPGHYLVNSPNTWTITARRGNRTLVLAAGGALTPPTYDALSSQAGDRVTVTVGPDCATEGVCGWIGSVMAFETE